MSPHLGDCAAELAEYKRVRYASCGGRLPDSHTTRGPPCHPDWYHIARHLSMPCLVLLIAQPPIHTVSRGRLTGMGALRAVDLRRGSARTGKHPAYGGAEGGEGWGMLTLGA